MNKIISHHSPLITMYIGILFKSNPWYSNNTNEMIVSEVGRAIGQAVSRWLTTAVARVQSRVRSSEICGGQSGAGAGFLRVLRFPLPILISLKKFPSSQSPGASTIGQ
jgi:hypothetical protein